VDQNYFQNHYASRVGKQTTTMLFSYHESGLLSRSFMLKEHKNMLEEIRSKTGKFIKYTERQLLFLESCVYIELVDSICHLIEDFSSICYALSDDLSKFPERIISCPNPKTVLKELNDYSLWYTIFRYPNLDQLKIKPNDKEFLKQHYLNNITTVQNFVKKIKEFLDLYWLFYNKRKHGNTLIYGLDKVEINGESTIIFPVFFNQKNPDQLKGVPFSFSMYEKNQKLFDTLFLLVNDLLMDTILFIERNGVNIMARVSYYEQKDEEKNRLSKLVQEYEKEVKRGRIQLTLKVNMDAKYLKPFFNFYNNLEIKAFNK
jgi:hypothetical protein